MNIAGFSISSYLYFPTFSHALNEQMTETDAKIAKVQGHMQYLNEQKENTLEEFIPYLEEGLNEQKKKLNNLIFYDTHKKFAEGSSATVYKIKRRSDSILHALKVGEKNSNSFLKNEIQMLHFLNEKERESNSEYLCRLIGAFKIADENISSLMPLYQSDFFDWIFRKGNFSEEECLKILTNILSILLFLKKEDVLHLDIKPENFFVTDQGKLILGDFGFARFLKNGPPTSTCGSPEYVSPEFVISTEFCDFAADMWSSAVTVCTVYLGSLKMFDQGRDPITETISLSQILQNHQKRFKKQFPEYLKIAAIENNYPELICPQDELSTGDTFDQVMGLSFFAKRSENLKAFGKLRETLKQMLEFDHTKRITPEAALELLSH